MFGIKFKKGRTMTSVEFNLRVLGYQDQDGEWAAHCLETDIVGRGSSFEEAVDDLRELTEMQVSFAVEKNQMALLDHPAPPHVWRLFDLVTTERLRNYPKPIADPTHAVGSLPLRELPSPPNGLAWANA